MKNGQKPRIVFLATVVTVIAWQTVGSPAVSGSPDYEIAPVLRASELAPPAILSGPHHRTEERVACDDYMHHYQIESDFGPFEVAGDAMLMVRVQEIEALSRMREISQTDAFQGALIAAAKSPFMGAKNLIVHPVSTVKGLPGGVARYFTGLFHRAKKGSHEATESMSNEDAEGGTGQGDDENEEAGDQNLEKQTKNIIGYEKARRRLAWRLGVDPYSTNPRLQEELDRLAWASFAGGFAAGSIPRVPGLSEAAMISEQVWTLPPEQVERRNGKKLKKMGVAKELYWELFYNERYSITVQTMLVDALKRLKGVQGRPGFVELAVQAQSDVEARFMTGLARILADRHERVGKLRALSTEGGLVLGLTRDGEIVLPVAVDILYWTEELEQAVSGSRLHAGQPEIWVSGHVTSRARSELADRGWVVHERCHGGAKPAAVVAEVPARHGD